MPKHARSQPGHVQWLPASRVAVFDDRPELGNQMRHVVTFDNVPSDWTNARIIENFGIADHLHVVRSGDRLAEVIQQGRR